MLSAHRRIIVSAVAHQQHRTAAAAAVVCRHANISHNISNSQLAQNTRHMSSSVSRTLRAQADANINDVKAQTAYYRDLMKSNDFAAVIDRAASRRFASNQEIEAMVQDAMAATQQQRPAQYAQQQQQPLYGNQQQQFSDNSYSNYNNSPQPKPSMFNRLFNRKSQQQQQQQQQQNSSLLGTETNPLIFVNAVRTSDTFKSGLIKFVFTTAAAAVIFLLVAQQFSSMTGGGANGPGGMFKPPSDVSITSKTKFSDVQGCDEAKAEFEQVVAYLKNPEKFTKLGGKMPKGVLMVGPPGTGKTLLARAVAGEAGVPFFAVSGSEFDEMFVGVGSKRVRELFAAAKKQKPAIIFIDEIDAVGGKRRASEHSSNRATMNQLLTEMDGFVENSGVIVIGATNFGDILDKALTRPGRFDTHVTLTLPDLIGRTALLLLYTKKVPMATDVNLQVLARGTSGCSGADLFNLINSASIRASAANKELICMEDLEYAKDKVLMGAVKSNAGHSVADVRNTAVHEAGHALVGLLTTGAMPIHKATVLPRGNSLGTTHFLPVDDMHSQSKLQMLAHMDVAMGGRAAEEIVNGSDNVSSGASGDLQNATSSARRMVMAYGLSERVGLMSVSEEAYRDASSTTKDMIDDEVKQLLAASYKRAHSLLQENRDRLDALADSLVLQETMTGVEMKALVVSMGKGDKAAIATAVSLATAAAAVEEAMQPKAGATGAIGAKLFGQPSAAEKARQ